MIAEIIIRIVNTIIVTLTLLLVFTTLIITPLIKRMVTKYLLLFNSITYITTIIFILSVPTVPHKLMHKIVMEEILVGYLILYIIIYKLLTRPEENTLKSMRKLDRITPTLLTLPVIQGILIQSTNNTLTIIYLGTIVLSSITAVIIEKDIEGITRENRRDQPGCG